MTDQELADAIRVKLGSTMPYNVEALTRFLNDNPPWKPTPGGRAWWGNAQDNVWTIGPAPFPSTHWVVKLADGSLRYVPDHALEPERTS